MEEFWILILVTFVATNSLDKAESVQLEELPLKIIDEIFGEGWWDNDKAEEWHKLTLEQNFLHQIDRQNTQIGQIEPNSTDQNPPLVESDHFGQIEPNSTDQNPPLVESDHFGQIEPNSTDQNPPLVESDHSGPIEPNSTDQNPPLVESDHFGQIEPNSTDQNPPLVESDHFGQFEPNSTDQNPPLTESDHSDNAKIDEEQNEILQEITANEKRKIIDKFHEMKDEFKEKGKFTIKERNQIEDKIAKHLKVNRKKIYKWKKEFGLSQKRKMHNFEDKKEEHKHLVEKFDHMKAELKRAGFKNSYPNQINETVAKELGLSLTKIYKWKSELGQTAQHKHSHSEQKELMKLYYEIKDQNPKISDKTITKMLKIGRTTLVSWKKQFKRQQFHSNSVDGHFVEENVAANIQEIGNSNSGSI